MGTAEAAKRRVGTWARAWPEADVDAIAALYAPEATFFGVGRIGPA
jgi:ketosteroid isomerase-like protein